MIKPGYGEHNGRNRDIRRRLLCFHEWRLHIEETLQVIEFLTQEVYDARRQARREAEQISAIIGSI